MSPARGPFAVIVRRTPDGWYRVTGLFLSRNGRHIARSCAGHLRERVEAVRSVRAVLR